MQSQATGQEGWQDQSHSKGETGMKETACTLWEKAWGAVGKGSNPLTSSPFKGLELLFTFCQRWKGKEEEEHLPHHPHRHTDGRACLSHPSSPKAPPPVGQHHIQGQTTTPQPHHDPPCLLPAAATPRNGGCPRSLPLTRSSLQARGSGQGERRRKGGSEGRGTAKGRRRELRTAIRTTTSRT